MANPDDSSGLAARIVDILDNPELRASMVVASRERALSEFNYDVLASRLGDVLKVGQ
jgi:glycosyltransferase involved in cell wall biosynthesis